MMQKQEVIDAIANAEMVLVGIGEEFSSCEKKDLQEAYSALGALLKDKNYYMITVSDDMSIHASGFPKDRICEPLLYGEVPEDHTDWIRYTKWLQGTLNRKLLILELGVGLSRPGIIRFPFEKITMINQKASLIRIHAHLYQLPEELADRGYSVQENAPHFLNHMHE